MKIGPVCDAAKSQVEAKSSGRVYDQFYCLTSSCHYVQLLTVAMLLVQQVFPSIHFKMISNNSSRSLVSTIKLSRSLVSTIKLSM